MSGNGDDRTAAVARAARELEAAGVKFVLVVEVAGGQGGVLSNVAGSTFRMLEGAVEMVDPDGEALAIAATRQ